MDESVVRHLERPQLGTLKLSDAIRIGHEMIGEMKVWLVCNTGCALAAAVVGAGHPKTQQLPYAEEMYSRCQELFPGAPRDLLREISNRHSDGLPRLQIADWLESIGH